MMEPTDNSAGEKSFAEQAESPQGGFISEMVDFILTNKKWWLTPIILVLLLAAILVLLGGSAGAPFIYTLF